MAELTQPQRILLLVLSVFLCVAGIGVGGRLLSKLLIGKAVVHRVIQARASDVSWISFVCDDGDEFAIRERESITEIISELNDSEEYSPNHPQCQRRCRMAIHYDSRSDTAPVRWNCRDPDGGALIYLYSQGTWGFDLGIWRSPQLEDAIAAARQHLSGPRRESAGRP
jgi:hypothetical protein